MKSKNQGNNDGLWFVIFYGGGLILILIAVAVAVWLQYFSHSQPTSALPFLAIGFFPKGGPEKWSWIDWIYVIMGVAFLIIAFACAASFVFSIAPL